jgi:hypothetical protein
MGMRKKTNLKSNLKIELIRLPKVGDKVKITNLLTSFELGNRSGTIKEIVDEHDEVEDFYLIFIPSVVDTTNKGYYYFLRNEFEILPDIFKLWE